MPPALANEDAHFAGGGAGVGGRGDAKAGGRNAHVGHGAHHVLGMAAGRGLGDLHRRGVALAGRNGDDFEAARAALRAPRIDDTIALALFYLSRRLRPPRRHGPYRARSVHFTLSDLSHWDLARLGAVRRARVLVTPSHPEHAGLTVTRVGDTLALTLLATRGVVPLAALRDHLRHTLELP